MGIFSGDYQKLYKSQQHQISTAAQQKNILEVLGFWWSWFVVTMNLVVMMINLYLYRGRDYGINI